MFDKMRTERKKQRGFRKKARVFKRGFKAASSCTLTHHLFLFSSVYETLPNLPVLLLMRSNLFNLVLGFVLVYRFYSIFKFD